MDTASLLWGMLFGAIGSGYLIYGHRQKNIVALSCGLALMFYTYFLSNNWLIVLVGVALMAIPFKFRV